MKDLTLGFVVGLLIIAYVEVSTYHTKKELKQLRKEVIQLKQEIKQAPIMITKDGVYYQIRGRLQETKKEDKE